jgi:hypothetical protein
LAEKEGLTALIPERGRASNKNPETVAQFLVFFVLYDFKLGLHRIKQKIPS